MLNSKRFVGQASNQRLLIWSDWRAGLSQFAFVGLPQRLNFVQWMLPPTLYLHHLFDLLLLVLKLVEFVIDAAVSKELLVRSHLPDLAFVHHDNLAGCLNC